MAEDLVGKVVLVHLEKGIAAGVLEKVTDTSIRLSNACDFVGCEQLQDSEEYLIKCLASNKDIVEDKPLQTIAYLHKRIRKIEIFDRYYQSKQKGSKEFASS